MAFSLPVRNTAGPNGPPLSVRFDHSNPLADVKDVIDNITNLLLNQISSVFKLKSEQIKYPLYVSVAASLTAFVSSLITALKTEQVGYIRIAMYTAPVASLFSFVSSIVSLLNSMNVDINFSAEASNTTIGSIMKVLYDRSNSNVENSMAPTDFLHYGIGLLALVIASGLTAFGFDPKCINTWLSMREHISKFSADIESFIKDFVEKVLQIDMTTDAIFSDSIQELSIEMETLLKTPATDFITDFALCARLHECIEKIRKVNSTKFSPEQSRRYSHQRQAFNVGYMKLISVSKVIAQIADHSLRQTCFGVVFQGPAGVGKSELAHYILRKVAIIMGYSTSVYNAKPGQSGDFYEIYGGQQMAIYNEFCSARQDKQGIIKLNEMISSDPCNLEAAHLDYKHQPCKFACLALTANKEVNTAYDFCTQISEDANVALMSRLTRFHVTDPNFEGREGANLHRDSNFGHLTIERIIPVKPPQERVHLSDYADNRTEKTTIDEIIDEMVVRCMNNEDRYVTKILENVTCLDDSTRAALRRKIESNEARRLAIPNSDKGIPFIVRFQGPIHTGKTVQVKNLAGTLAQALDLPIHKVSDFKTKPTDKVGIFILDDIPENLYHTGDYVQWINEIHHKSIVLICSNYIMPIKTIGTFSLRRLLQAFTSAYESTFDIIAISFWIKLWSVYVNYTESYYDMSSIQHLPPGVMRRLGISGTAWDGEKFIHIPGSHCCITTSSGWTSWVNTKATNALDPTNVVSDQYFAHLRQVSDFTVVHANPPCVEPDITIKIHDFDKYAEAVSTYEGCLNMFMSSNHPGGTIYIKPERREHLLRVANVKAWVLPTPPQQSELLQSIKPTILRLAALCPNVVVRLEYAETIMLYDDRVLYSTQKFDDTVEVLSGVIYVSGKPVTCGPLALFYTRGFDVLDDLSLSGYSGSDLIRAKQFITSNLSDPALELYRIAIETQQQQMSQATSIRNKHPLVKFFSQKSPARTILASIGVCLGGLTAIFGVYKLINHLSKDTNEVNTPNGAGSPPTHISKAERQRMAQEYWEHIQGGRNRTDFIEKQLKKGFTSHQMDRWTRMQDYNAHENQATTDQITSFRASIASKLDKDQLGKFDKLCAGLVMSNTAIPNNVHSSSVISEETTVISGLENTLRRATLRVDIGSGCNYGLLIKNRFFITVAHAGNHGDEVFVLWTPDDNTPCNRYSAEIIARDASRDLMLCEITDKTFPMSKDITPSVLSMIDKRDWSSTACYIRTVPGGSRYFGTASYLGKRKTPLSGTSPDWSPDDYITYHCYTTGTMFGVHRRGDCGLPLVAVRDNKAFLVGIHNSVTPTGGGNFSPVYREELEALMVSKVIPNSTVQFAPSDTVIPTLEGHKNIPDYNTILEKTRPTKIWENHPEIPVVGYNHLLKFFSKPRFGKIKIHDEKNVFPCTTKPSPTSRLAETAKINLPKDINGTPSPLLAQTKKFFARGKINFDEDIHGWARSIHQDLLETHVGPIRMLRGYEIINGIPEGNLKVVDMDSSAGPYFKAMYRVTTKKPLFVDHNSQDLTKPRVYGYSNTPAGQELASQVTKILSVWNDSEPIAIFIKDNPKVELISEEDADIEGKIRLFCELDVSVNLAYRHVIGDFVSKSHQMHHFLPSRLGFNPYCFPQTYMHQFANNKKSIATDIKRLDKNFPTILIDEFFLALFNLATTDEHRAKLTGAAKSLHRTVHMQDGVLYVVEGGNPSGIAGTTPLNCFAGDRIALYIYVKWAIKNSLYLELHFSSFMSYTGLATYGDDQNWQLHPDCDINIKDICAGFAEFGLEIVPSKNFPPGSVEFCSREFVFDSKHCIYYSRLKQESIIQSLYWIDIAHKEILPALFLTTLFEASMWDRDFFLKVKREIIYQSKVINLDINTLKLFDYDKQREHFAKYVRGEERSPIVTEIGAEGVTSSPFEQSYNRGELYKMPAYIYAYHNECRKRNIRTAVQRKDTTSTSEVDGQPVLLWTVTLTHDEIDGTASDPDISEALRFAYKDLYYNRFDHPLDEDAALSKADDTEFTIRYQENNACDDSRAHWSLHTDEELVTIGECVPAQPFTASRGAIIRQMLSKPGPANTFFRLLEECPELTTETMSEARIRDICEMIKSTDPLLENNVTVQPKYLHRHVCVKCGCLYEHQHFYRKYDHKQFPNQCPNKKCVWYGIDQTKSALIDYNASPQ